MNPKIVIVGVRKFGKNHLRVLKKLEKDRLCTLYGVVERALLPGYLVASNPSRIIKKVKDNRMPLGFYKRGEVYSWRRK